MTGSIQTTTAPIGSAPQMQTQGTGMLPDLTQQQGAAATGGATATAPVTTTPAAATTGGAAAAAPASGLDISALGASIPSWLGPVTAIAGLGLTAFAFSKGKGNAGMLKAAGIGATLAGVGTTALSAHSRGTLAGRTAATNEIMPAFESYQAQAQQLISSMQTEYQTTIDQMQGGGTTGTTPGTTGGTPGTTPATTPGTTPSPDGSAQLPLPSNGQGAPVVDVPTGTQVTGSAAALVGTSVSLPAGAGSTGQVAAPGNFTIAGVLGDPAGYATLDAANAAVQATVSTDTMGSSHLRWLVIESGGKFYGTVAQSAETGVSGAALTQQQGTLVAWNAINHTDDAGWQAFSWTAAAGGRSAPVAYGTANPFAGAGQTQTQPQTQAPTTSSTGAAPTFDPAGEIGRTFAVNDSGDVRGGSVQLQSLAGSATGYASAEEAASAARQARAGGGTDWSRWVTTQASDGRFYLYAASIVNRPTADLQGAAPLHVFGTGFAEYFDGATAAWTAVADAA